MIIIESQKWRSFSLFVHLRENKQCLCIKNFCSVLAYSSMAVPLMLCPYTSTLVLISPTSEGRKAESTTPGVNSVVNGAQTQEPKIPSQPP